MLFLRLGDDLAVAVGVEAVEHHAVVAGELADRSPPSPSASASSVRRGAQACDRGGQPLRKVARRAPRLRQVDRLEFEDHRIGVVAMDQRLEAAAHAVALDVAAQRPRRRAHAGEHTRPHLCGKVAAQDFDRAADQLVDVESQHFAHVRAGLQHARRRGLEHEQRAMRLDRARMLDQFPIAIRQVGLAKGRRVAFIGHVYGCAGCSVLRRRLHRASTGMDIFGPHAAKSSRQHSPPATSVSSWIASYDLWVRRNNHNK